MNRKRLIIMLCILLCWMVLIFGFSAQTSVSSASLSRAVLRKLLALLPGWNTLSPVAQALRVRKVHHMFRKLGHFSEYTVLGVITALTGRLCFPADNRTQQRVRYFIVPACFALLYAVGDEIHQCFVPGRTPLVTDVLIDFAGACLGTLLTAAAARMIARHKEKKQAAQSSH